MKGKVEEEKKKKPAKWLSDSQRGTAFKEKHTHTITASGRHNITRSVRSTTLKVTHYVYSVRFVWEKSTGDLQSL